MRPSRIRVGIVGAGANTKARHIPGLLAREGVEILSVCNRSRASSEAAAAEFHIPRTADSWQALVEDSDLDAVLIGTWPCLHAPVTLAAVAAGKHVLCEARMAMNLSEARRMLEASQARPELVTMVVPSPFTFPWDRTIQRLLRDGALGELLQVDVFANCSGFLQPDRPMNWRDDRELSGLNTQMLGIYYEAMMRWTGPAAVRAARARNVVPRRKDAAGVLREQLIPDHLEVMGEFPNGAGLFLRCSQVTGACPTPNDFVLYGSEGTLRLDLSAGRLSLSAPGAAAREVIPSDEERGSWRVEEEFIRAIRGQEPVTHTTFADGVRYMEFTEAVAKAAGYA